MTPITATLPGEFPLGLLPTPLQTVTLPGRVELLIKRDDLTGLGFGGNKVRKLRFLLAEAAAQQTTVLLTWGGPQSNHCALTACAAPLAGMRCELFFNKPEPAALTGNQRVDVLLSAQRHFLGQVEGEVVEQAMQARAEELRAHGERPYLIGLGGSSPLGILGYVQAMQEVRQQLAGQQPPTHLVVTGGSLGTLAGIILGSWVYDLPTQVDSYSVLWPQVQAAAQLEHLLDITRQAYFPDLTPRANYALFDTQLGEGYGQPTPAGQQAAAYAAQHAGLILDQTYTAKAFAGLLAGMHSGRYQPGQRLLYWHTGGAGGFFA